MSAGGSFERVLERTSSTVSQADWRLLPGVPEGGRALVLATRGTRVAEALAIVFEEVVVVNAGREQEPTEGSSSVRPPGAVKVLGGCRDLPELPDGSFDLVACPHGWPRALLPAPLQGSLGRLRSLVRPGGALVLGLPSIARSLTRARGLRSRGGVFLRRRLERAGFDAVEAHLALPQHRAPSLLAPSTGPAASFALDLHAAGRLPQLVRRCLLQPLGAAVVGALLVDQLLVARRPPLASPDADPC